MMSSKNTERLFSYRTLDDAGYELGNIDSGVIYFGNIGDFNDPSEGMVRNQKLIHGSSPFSGESLLKAARILYRDISPNWLMPTWFIRELRRSLEKDDLWSVFCDLNKVVGEVESFRNKLRVLCTTPVSMHSLMWAHYADSHKGVCIEYEVDYSNLPKGVSGIPVCYTNEYKNYSINDFVLNPTDFLGRLLFTKHSDWSYESEHRFVLYDGNTSIKSSSSFKIVSVTSGLKCTKDAELKEICAKRGLNLFKVAERGIDGLVRVPIEKAVTNT